MFEKLGGTIFNKKKCVRLFSVTTGSPVQIEVFTVLHNEPCLSTFGEY